MTHEQELVEIHLKHATEMYEKVAQQVETLRAELYGAMKRAEQAEQSRDIIRSHAQVALEKYRAQAAVMLIVQGEFERERGTIALDNAEHHNGYVAGLESVLKRNKSAMERFTAEPRGVPERCAHVPYQGIPEADAVRYGSCTRDKGHTGPCAHPLADPSKCPNCPHGPHLPNECHKYPDCNC